MVRRLPEVCFNSCPREGGIFVLHFHSTARKLVSTRAPAKGASKERAHFTHTNWSFNSCPREGGIEVATAFPAALPKFQLVPPRRGHPDSVGASEIEIVFQLVPPRRGHPKFINVTVIRAYSFNSCPREGGISKYLLFTLGRFTFQLVPPRRGHPLIF